MVFSSSTFLLFFLPVSVVLYFLMPGRAAKNVWLFVVSLVFYAWGEPVYIWLMLVSVLVNWLFGIALGQGSQGRKRFLLALNLLVNLALLGFFKYEGFVAENVNDLVGSQVVPNLELSLPIGISFYTLQAVSYIIDVYRGEVAPQRNVIYLGMYIACFPQLVAGPIVRYSTIQDQVENRRENVADFCAGLRLFIVGLAKKVLLANVVAILADKMLGLGGPAIGAVGAWAGLLAYTFQIYFDFAGYSDMAIGLGKMFGFKYLRNFNYPYLSKSASEFWRRWHISLSSFFRDYIYIPLGGSRVKTPRWVFNIAVVWAITGLWHGAAWNFVLWGVYWGALLVCEKLLWGRLVERLPGFVRHIYGIVLFMLGWLIFWITDMEQMKLYFKAMLGWYGATGTSTFWELTCWEYVPVFLACALASTPVVPWVRSLLVRWAHVAPAREGRFCEVDLPAPKNLSTDALCVFEPTAMQGDAARLRVLSCVAVLCDVALLALLVVSVVAVCSGSYNPFIYFRF